jgi:hypothetical protein
MEQSRSHHLLLATSRMKQATDGERMLDVRRSVRLVVLARVRIASEAIGLY